MTAAMIQTYCRLVWHGHSEAYGKPIDSGSDARKRSVANDSKGSKMLLTAYVRRMERSRRRSQSRFAASAVLRQVADGLRP